MSGAAQAPTRSNQPAGWLRLQCRPGREDGTLVFPYEVTNAGPLPVLVMDAWPSHRQDDEVPHADPQLVQVTLRVDGLAVVGKYVPALPENVRMLAPHLPLCVVLNPGDTLKRELRVRLPLAEQSPYVPEGRLSQYESTELKGLVVAIGWWPLAQKGIAAAAWPWSPEHQAVVPLTRLPPAGAAQQRFPTTRLDILRRVDAFPRNMPLHPDLLA